MSRGRHRVAPVRRPVARPVVAVAVAATMLSGPALLAMVPPAPDTAPTVAAPSTAGLAEALQLSAVAARDEAQASRGQVRSTPPTVEAEPSVAPSAEPSAEPSAPASAEPEPEPSETPEPAAPPEVVGQLWATSDVNVRAEASADSERVGYLTALDQVDVTGTTEDGWTQVVLEDAVGWVNDAYLSDSEPEPEPAADPDPEAGAATAAGTSDEPCAINPGIESGLTGNARAVYRAVCAAYGGSVSGFGGLRPGDGGDHGSGRAVDVMVSGEAGWEISRFLQDRAGELGITYLIYEQKIWMAGSGSWEQMEDRGGATANHYDHVHVSVG